MYLLQSVKLQSSAPDAACSGVLLWCVSCTAWDWDTQNELKVKFSFTFIVHPWQMPNLKQDLRINEISLP